MKGVFSLALVAAASASPVLFDATSQHADAAPIHSAQNAVEIADSYMIKFKDHVTQNLAAVHHEWVDDLHTTKQARKTELRKRSQEPFLGELFAGLKHTYNIAGSLMGYSGHFDEETIEQIRRHPDVAYIERDQEVHVLEHKHNHSDPELEKSAPWGLARLSNREALGFGNFNKYYYAADGGEGVDVYVIDTGTNIEHVDFEGRASWGKTIPQGDPDEDGNGHGTHCSGTVGGHKFGVAKKAHIKAVKVLRSNGSGSMSDVVKGVEYAAESHSESVSAAKSGKKKGFKGSTANMSLGGGKSSLLDQAVNAAVDAGIHFAVAAGNDNADSCNYSPAAAEKAVTVGASTLKDERAYFSNFGKCNDIFAPGLNIESTWKGSKYAVNTISGTSMASPHIAGLLAYLLSLQPSKDSAYAVADITPKELKANLIAIATEGALTEVPSDTANLLAWNGGGEEDYDSIIKHGGYRVAQDSEEITLDFGMVREGVDDVENIEAEFMEALEEMAEKVQFMEKKVEDFVTPAATDALHKIEEKTEAGIEKIQFTEEELETLIRKFKGEIKI